MPFAASDLLLSKRNVEVTEQPFCFFYVDDYLPPELYRSLLASFPEQGNYSHNVEGKLGFRSSEHTDAVERFCARHEDWKRLVDFFGSDAFLDDVRSTFARALVRARGWSGRKRWANFTGRAVSHNPLRYLLQEPVRTTFQFSLLPRDAVVLPHPDAPRKLVSLVLYFRDPDWSDAWGGGTQFLAPLDRARARRWSPTQRVPFEEFKLIDTTDFRANRLIGFVRSDDSYHGVQPPACPPGAARKALLVNIKRVKWSKRSKL